MYEKSINDIPHYIFEDKNEFYEKFPNERLYENWKEAPEGAWTETDDGQVLEILKRGKMRNGASRSHTEYVRTLLGMLLWILV